MPRPPSILVLTLASGLAWAAATGAAEPVESTAPLDLAAAIELAQDRHETPEIALARLEKAQAFRRQAVAVLLPGLTLSGTYTRRAREVTRDISGDIVTVQAIDALQAQAVADSTLFDLRALPLVRAATAGVAAQERESNELRRALAFDVAQGFLDALSSERLLAAARERVRVAEETLRQTRIRLEAGLANRNDATRTELELATAQVVATQAANLVATARLGLSFLIDEPLQRRPLVDPVETELPTGGVEALLARAESGRDDLSALAERARQSRQLALVPRYGFAPRFDLRGLYRWTNEAGLSGREEDWNVALNLTWEVFDGGERYAVAAQRDAEAREAELVYERTRREIERDVRQALADLDSAEAAVAQAEVRQQVSRANAEEVHERFLNGLATALEEADALASRFEADVEVVRQRFARSAARLDLLRSLGDWPLVRPTAITSIAPQPSETAR
jgi:outer membrane protein